MKMCHAHSISEQNSKKGVRVHKHSHEQKKIPIIKLQDVTEMRAGTNNEHKNRSILHNKI